MSFSLVPEKNNQEEERFVSIKSGSLPPLLRPTLASTELAFNSISSEVFGDLVFMWIPLEMNLGLGSFLVKLQKTPKSRSSKV